MRPTKTAGFGVGVCLVGLCAFFFIPVVPELAYGFAIAAACGAVVLACALLLRVRHPEFAVGLAWGAATGVVLALGAVLAVMLHVVSNSA